MANEIKYNRDCAAGATPEARIANRLRNSGGDNRAAHVVKTGDGPQRVFHNIHDKGMKQGNVRQRGMNDD